LDLAINKQYIILTRPHSLISSETTSRRVTGHEYDCPAGNLDRWLAQFGMGYNHQNNLETQELYGEELHTPGLRFRDMGIAIRNYLPQQKSGQGLCHDRHKFPTSRKLVSWAIRPNNNIQSASRDQREMRCMAE
jgi:hypothetical protein